MKPLNKTNRIIYSILIILFAGLVSCSKSDDNNPEQIEKQADVYVAGYEWNGTKDVAKVWKNSIGTKLSNEDSEANSVFVWNNKVFAAGNEGSPAVIWEDGKPTKLTIEGSAYSVFVVERK